MKTKKRLVAGLCAFALVGTCAIGGTLAWLTDKTGPVVNTFTVGDIDIKLAENTGGTYKMVPGYTIKKDPKATVLANSEKCYLYVKVEKSTNASFDDYLTYEMADGWQPLGSVENVFYRVVDTNVADQEFSVLKDDQVTVRDTVTKTMMDTLTLDTYPKLTVTAYASQFMKNNTVEFTAEEAWNNLGV